MAEITRLCGIVFDAYGTLFDVYSVQTLADALFPGHGAAIARLWRDRQIDYSRLRTMSGRYADFWRITEDALEFACATVGVTLGHEARERLMGHYARLAPHPENRAALDRLRAHGLPLAILSNGTARMLASAIDGAGLGGVFAHVLSIETVEKFKTAPEAYQLAPDAFGCAAAELLFVSSNCWDAIGAAWFGFPTFWINRAGQPVERLGVAPLGSGATMDDLVAFVAARAARPAAPEPG